MDVSTSLETVLAILRSRAPELRRRGVIHVAVFGSVARQDDRPDSDVDLLVELEPDVAADLFAYAGVASDLEEMLARPVDVAQLSRLRPHVRPSAEAQAIRAF